MTITAVYDSLVWKVQPPQTLNSGSQCARQCHLLRPGILIALNT